MELQQTQLTENPLGKTCRFISLCHLTALQTINLLVSVPPITCIPRWDLRPLKNCDSKDVADMIINSLASPVLDQEINRCFLFSYPQENKASKNLIEHLKDQIGDKETKVKELEEIQNTIINMMQATKKKKTGWEGDVERMRVCRGFIVVCRCKKWKINFELICNIYHHGRVLLNALQKYRPNDFWTKSSYESSLINNGKEISVQRYKMVHFCNRTDCFDGME